MKPNFCYVCMLDAHAQCSCVHYISYYDMPYRSEWSAIFVMYVCLMHMHNVLVFIMYNTGNVTTHKAAAVPFSGNQHTRAGSRWHNSSKWSYATWHLWGILMKKTLEIAWRWGTFKLLRFLSFLHFVLKASTALIIFTSEGITTPKARCNKNTGCNSGAFFTDYIHCAKTNTIHQVTTMLATSKMSYFQVITTC